MSPGAAALVRLLLAAATYFAWRWNGLDETLALGVVIGAVLIDVGIDVRRVLERLPEK